MSSAGNFDDGGEFAADGTGNSRKNYYCYECHRTVTLATLPNSELSCPNCNSTFLEESRTAENNPAGEDYPGSGGGDILSELFGVGDLTGGSPVEIDPVLFMNHYLRVGGANIRLLLENYSSGGDVGSEFRLTGRYGDYFLDSGLEQLIQHLSDDDLIPARHGTPPAAKSAVSGLPDVKVSDELLNSDSSQCAVCKDSFELDELVKQLACKHIYHKDCILPWLELRNSCPVCRYELPTDDYDYENRRSSQRWANTSRNSNTNNNDNQGNPLIPRTVERRVRISLPALLRGLEPHAETSNSGGGGSDSGVDNDGNNSNNNSNSNSVPRKSNTRPGGQARQEDLD